MFTAGVLVIVAVIGSTQSELFRDNSGRRTRLPQEASSANEVNSPSVLCPRKIFGRGDCVDKLTAATRGDYIEKCESDQVLVKGKCYRKYDDFIVLGSETSEEEKTFKLEEKLPTICHRGSELVDDKCVDKFSTETNDKGSVKCKSGDVLVKGICFSLDEIASPESSEEYVDSDSEGKTSKICPRGFELLGEKCVDKDTFEVDGAEENKKSVVLKCPPDSKIIAGLCTESNSFDSEDHRENDEIAKILNEFFKTLENRQSGGQTPENCLRGSVLIGGKCVDLFSRGSGIDFTEVPITKDITKKKSEKKSLPVICSRNGELIDGKCEDNFQPEEMKMDCPLNYIMFGDKCIDRDFDQDTIVFPSELTLPGTE